MTQAQTYILMAVAGWLVTGLAIEAVLVVRQWRHLGRLVQNSGGTLAADGSRMTRYGQRRAVFQWLAAAETVARVALWLPGGLLLMIHRPFAEWGLVGAIAFFIVFALLDQLLRQLLPWARWRWVDRPFGMTRMGAADLVRDTGRTLALDGAIAGLAAAWVLWPFVFASFAVAWMASGVLAVAGAAVLFWARPHLIAPLFNRFRPLAAGELRTRLDAMMHRCGTRLNDVLVVDSSRRSNLANAYFTGIGRSKRVVLFDTLIDRLEPAELEAVMAHELGHYRCGHLRRYYGLLGVLILLAYMACGALQPTAGLSLPPAVAVVAAYLLLPALGWPLKPWLATLRRRYEYEADAYAARHAEPGALRSALEKLLAHNLNAPTMDRWYAVFHATHPPGEDRLQRLREHAAYGT